MNEDRVLERPNKGFWAVADGMGGHRGGDVAASRLITALDAVEHSGAGFSRLSDVVQQVNLVNASLFEEASPTRAIRGATLVALLAHEDHYACLWAGDSRAYRWRAGALTPLTRDHSVVQVLVDNGIVTESDRKSHPNSHVVTRAVGAGSSVELETNFEALAGGDIFLLCSDGLTACVDDDEFSDILRGQSPDAIADRLLSMALERDAPDNVSLIVIQADRR